MEGPDCVIKEVVICEKGNTEKLYLLQLFDDHKSIIHLLNNFHSLFWCEQLIQLPEEAKWAKYFSILG
jgi:hypothetical protein